jgi:hypothetical protein
MMNTFKANDNGAYGKAFEIAVKQMLGKKACVSACGKTDLRYGKYYEIKTGAGVLDYTGTGKAMCYGSSMVIYAPVVDEDNLLETEAFVMTRKVFLETLDELGMIRRKVSTAGLETLSIQTFWNRSKNQPHGAKYGKMIDRFYELIADGEAELFADWCGAE